MERRINVCILQHDTKATRAHLEAPPVDDDGVEGDGDEEHEEILVVRIFGERVEDL
jgi:hypothetical protein